MNFRGESGMLKIQPFNDFWLDCGFNSTISILCSLYEGYKDLAFYNNFIYDLQNEGTPTSYTVIIDQNTDKYIDNLFSKEFIEMGSNISNELKSNIAKAQQNQYIFFLGVDLFYWVDNSICWHKNHWYHHSLVTEYEDGLSEVIALDDDFNGYQIQRIPFSRAIIASENYIKNHPNHINDAYFLIDKHVKENFSYNKDDIMCNNLKIIISLDNVLLKNHECWVIRNNELNYIKENLTLFSMRCFQFYNRHKANLMFFNNLYELQFISLIQKESLSQYSIQIMHQWDILKGKLIKTEMQARSHFDSDEFITVTSKLFQREKEIWSSLNYMLAAK